MRHQTLATCHLHSPAQALNATPARPRCPFPLFVLRTGRVAADVAGPLAIGAWFCVLLALTWRKWPDLLIDFGRELYVPWQLTEGAVLYRDIAYFNGPFSPCWNAVLFRIGGTSLTTLAVANAAVLAMLTAVLYRLAVELAGRLTATVGCFVFLALFAFAQFREVGNYNYICPYSHELTHGVAFAFFMVALLAGESASWRRVASAGICWGLSFLGKPEIFVAASVAAAVVLAMPALAARAGWRKTARRMAIFSGFGAVPVGLLALALATRVPLLVALQGVAGSWFWLLTTDAARGPFYLAVAGLDRPLAHVLEMLQGGCGVALVLAIAVTLDSWRCGVRGRGGAVAVCGGLVTLLLLRGGKLFPLLLDNRALLLASLATCGGLGWGLWQRRRDAQAFWGLLPLPAWSVMGAMLLLKILLAPRFHHYGFVLAMPATILAVVCLTGFLPAFLCRRWQGGTVFRAAVLVMLLADTCWYLQLSSRYLERKTLLVGEGADRIATYEDEASPVGYAVGELLDDARTWMPAGATWVALPEGIMLNYLARRRNPTGYTNFMPPELAMFGQAAIVSALDEHRPDFILLVHKDTAEYGMGVFGSRSYGHEILRWVRRHYRPVKTILATPFAGDSFGIQILQRADLGSVRESQDHDQGRGDPQPVSASLSFESFPRAGGHWSRRLDE